MQSGLRATDTLANERTYLAYIRTAIALIAFGYVVARFSLFVQVTAAASHLTLVHTGALSTIFGGAMAFFGMVVGVIGGCRYARTERALREGRVLSLSPTLGYTGSIILVAAGVLVVLSISALP